MDFCEKYCLNELKKEYHVQFIERLKGKRQTAQKQAYHAILLFYELAGPTNPEKVALLKNKNGKLATKKAGLKLMNANLARSDLSQYKGKSKANKSCHPVLRCPLEMTALPKPVIKE